MSVDVVTGWNPSLETVGIVVAVVTAFFVAVQAVAVVIQAWSIRGGLNQMRRASDERDQQLKQQAIDSERRHREMMQSLADQRTITMRALEALIERTAPVPPGGVAG